MLSCPEKTTVRSSLINFNFNSMGTFGTPPDISRFFPAHINARVDIAAFKQNSYILSSRGRETHSFLRTSQLSVFFDTA